MRSFLSQCRARSTLAGSTVLVAAVALLATGGSTYAGTGTSQAGAVAAGSSALSAGVRARTAKTAAAADQSLRKDLDALLDDPALAGETASVLVRRADGPNAGDVLYDRAPDTRVSPASNAKLFTSAAALDTLGPDHRFATDVLATGKRQAQTLVGNLYLRGRGDPTMLASDYDALAAKVAAAGVTRVVGNLVADDTWWDDVRLGPDWSWDDEPYYYSAQISPLTLAPNEDYDAGTVIVRIRPGTKAGAPALVDLVPSTSYVRIVNHATTSGTGTSLSTDVERRHGTNTIDVFGSIPLGHADDLNWASVDDPTLYATSVFRDALTAHGVQVLGPTQRGATPKSADLLADHESMTVQQLMTPFLKLSNNGHAEDLTKEMGRVVAGEGSWDAGDDVRAKDLDKLGVDTGTMRLVDGSGLARMDIVTARQVTDVLLAARHRPWFAAWYDALPIACQNARMVGGTLRFRMCDTPAAGNVHGKTGSLTGVSALSGYVTDADGDPLVFSVLMNSYIGNVDPTVVQDRIAERLASYTSQVDSGRVAAAGVGSGRTSGRTSGADDTARLHRRPLDVECSWVRAC